MGAERTSAYCAVALAKFISGGDRNRVAHVFESRVPRQRIAFAGANGDDALAEQSQLDAIGRRGLSSEILAFADPLEAARPLVFAWERERWTWKVRVVIG
jgi:hypothetical protein